MSLLARVKKYTNCKTSKLVAWLDTFLHRQRRLKIFFHDTNFFIIKRARARRFNRRFLQNYEVPQLLRLEISTNCNAACRHCPITTIERKGKLIDDLLFKKIADDAAGNNISCLQFGGIGEPLLHPSLVEKVAYLKKKKIGFVEIMTNASLLDRTLAKSLINAGLDRICIGMDGATKKTYEAQRKGLDFDLVRNNIHECICLRGIAKKPLIHLNFCRTKLNLHEWHDFLKEWGPKVDSTGSWPLWPNLKEEENMSPPRFPSEIFYTKRAACPFIWHEMDSCVNGIVQLCCAAPHSTVVLGDFNKQSLKEIWHSPVIENYRQNHLAGVFASLNLCNKCDIWRFSHYRAWYC